MRIILLSSILILIVGCVNSKRKSFIDFDNCKTNIDQRDTFLSSLIDLLDTKDSIDKINGYVHLKPEISRIPTSKNLKGISYVFAILMVVKNNDVNISKQELEKICENLRRFPDVRMKDKVNNVSLQRLKELKLDLIKSNKKTINKNLVKQKITEFLKEIDEDKIPYFDPNNVIYN